MSTVIKSKEFERISGKAFPFSLKDVEKEASLILSQAQLEADGLLVEARAKAERIKIEAHEQARTAGREQGLAEGNQHGLIEAKEGALADYAAKAGQLTSTFHNVLSELNRMKKEIQSRAENDLLVLAMEISRRVVKRTGQFDRNVVVENLKDVIHRIGSKSDVQVRIHPSDMAAVELFAKELTVAEKEWEHVDLLADDTISPGGCKLILREGQMDATLESQLDHIGTLLVPEDRDQA
jgi:flagellar assembly protein FliH